MNGRDKCCDLPPLRPRQTHDRCPHPSFSPSCCPFNTMRHKRYTQNLQPLFVTNVVFAFQPWLAVSCVVFHSVDGFGFSSLLPFTALSGSFLLLVPLSRICLLACLLISLLFLFVFQSLKWTLQATSPGPLIVLLCLRCWVNVISFHGFSHLIDELNKYDSV